MSNFFHFAVKKLYFKLSFNNIGGSHGPFSYFWGVLAWGTFVQGFSGGLCPPRGFCPGVYFLEPQGAHVPIFVHMSVINYGLLHENITTLVYFVFLGDRSSALSLSVGFSDGLAFVRYL